MTTATFGAQVRRHRWRLQMKQIDLATKAGISSVYLCQIEHDNRCPSDAVALRLAKVLGCRYEATRRLVRRKQRQ